MTRTSRAAKEDRVRTGREAPGRQVGKHAWIVSRSVDRA